MVGTFGGQGKERIMIGGIQEGFWCPGDILFLRLDGFWYITTC